MGPEGCSLCPNPALHARCTRWGVQGTGHRALNLCFAAPCWKTPQTSTPARGSLGAPPPQTPSSSSPKSPGALLHPQHKGRRWYPMGSGCPSAGIPSSMVHSNATTTPCVPRWVGTEQLLLYNSPLQRVSALQASPCRDFSSTPFAASRWLLPAHTKGCDQLFSFIPSWGSRGLGTWCSSIFSCYMEVLAPALGTWWCHAWVSGNCLHLQVVTKNTK